MNYFQMVSNRLKTIKHKPVQEQATTDLGFNLHLICALFSFVTLFLFTQK
jgi:hypothetical protein